MNEPVDPSPSEPLAALTGPMPRRRALSLFGLGGIGLIAAACGSSSSGGGTPATTAGEATSGTTGTTGTTGPAGTTATTVTAAATSDLAATPEETGGPFPADGSNDNGEGSVADVLADARIVRSDIRSDLDGSNTQDGVPMVLTMNVVDSSGQALTGAAVYIWHCTREGGYSAYNSQMIGGDYSDRSYLRGVQVTDDAGQVTFQTILPGRYSGRAFHIHFEVYADDSYGTKLLTSQMGVDDDLIDSLYSAADGYDDALRNDTDNARDNVFGDGVDHQLLEISGDVASGITATFTAVV
jgi:protocatechuate 3,4-dioxygenase beta subunit